MTRQQARDNGTRSGPHSSRSPLLLGVPIGTAKGAEGKGEVGPRNEGFCYRREASRWFPIPLPRPLCFALEIEPLVKVPLLKPVPTGFIFCSVFFLQYGQKRFVIFGIFMSEEENFDL